MGNQDLISGLTRELYVSDPDAYWEVRGGPGYPSTLKKEYRDAVTIQKLFYQKILREHHPKVLLDFGCGTGKHFDLWHNVQTVFAYDRSRSMIDVSRETQVKLGTGYNILHGNSSDRVTLPFEDGQFDVIAACEVLPHILETDIAGVIAEMRRVLATDGVLGAVVSPKNHSFQPHSYNHNYEKLFSDSGFRISYDADFQGYRFLIVEKEIVDGRKSGNGSTRGHLAFTQDKTLGAFGRPGKPSAGMFN